MTAAISQDIKDSLRHLHLEDERPWFVGFSGGKDSTMLASLIFDVALSIPPEQRKKPISVLCTWLKEPSNMNQRPKEGVRPNHGQD